MSTHTPSTPAALTTVLQTTVAAGDTVIIPKGVDWGVNIDLKSNLGTTANDVVTIIVAEYASNFKDGVRALLGVDDANCASLHSNDSTDGGDGPIMGGLNSWYAFYGIKFDDAIDAGTRKPSRLVNIGEHNGEFSSGTAQAGTTTSITLAASETANWVNDSIILTGGTGSGQKRKLTSYDTGTKVGVPDVNFSPAPDGTTTYRVTQQEIYNTNLGKAEFYHCLFAGSDIADNGHGLLHATQGLVVKHCDFQMKTQPGENKCITSNNGYGPVTIQNNRLKNSTIAILFADATPGVLIENPNSAPGSKIDFNFVTNDTSETGGKNAFEIKSGENLEYCDNVITNWWLGTGNKGQAINFTWGVGGSESRSNAFNSFHDNHAYNVEVFFTVGSAGAGATQTTDIQVYNNLVITGYDVRDMSDATNPAIGLASVVRLSCYHNTVLGMAADRRLGAGSFRYSRDNGDMPNFVLRDNVVASSDSVIFTFANDTAQGDAAHDSSCGDGLWTIIDNVWSLNGESTSIYNRGELDDTLDSNWLVANQAAVDAVIDTTTYETTDVTKVSTTDGTLVGAPVTSIYARTAGVESGYPVLLNPLPAGGLGSVVLYAMTRGW